MIVSASRRTDIPCFYGDWFLRRLQEGFACTRNPMNAKQIRRVSLSNADVDAFVFWTKDAKPFFPVLDELDKRGFLYIFQFTLTPYGHDLERNLRDKDVIANGFLTLGKRIGRERLLWRYDPIVLNETQTISSHKQSFARLCEKLHTATNTVYISFVDNYAKLRSNLLRPVTAEEQCELADVFVQTARRFGLSVHACCEANDFTRFGVQPAACIDKTRLERLLGRTLNAKPDRNQRKGCNCTASVDIGAYDTCRNGCVYCYACHSDTAVARRSARHNAESPFLID